MSNGTDESTRLANEVFCELGRFSVKFEHVVSAMAYAITFTLQKNGLRNQQLAHIVLAEQTAYPIKSMLQAMVAQVAQLDESERGVVNRIFKRVQDLIDHRNQLLHSFTVVGAADEGQEFAADGFKLSRGRTGSGTKDHRMSATALRELCSECTAVESLINGLQIAIMTERKIGACFSMSNDEVKRNQVS